MPDFTDNQKRAIKERGKNILITAAAGSGKTTVLAARIAALVEEGADVSRILVCTFTSAAAAEMKGRIADTLARRARETGSRRLAEQSEKAVNADICTIHSFAQRIIKENFAHIGVPADLRAAGEEETASLKQQACDAVFDALYEEEDEQFLALRAYTGGRTDDNAAKLVKEHYAFLMSLPEGLEWYDKSGGEAWKSILSEELKALTASIIGAAKTAAEEAARICASHLPAEEDALALTTALKKQLAEELADIVPATAEAAAGWFIGQTPARRKKIAEMFPTLEEQILKMAEAVTKATAAEELAAVYGDTLCRMSALAAKRAEIAESEKWREQYLRACDDANLIGALASAAEDIDTLRGILSNSDISRMRPGLMPEEDRAVLANCRELLKAPIAQLKTLYADDPGEALSQDSEYIGRMAAALKHVVFRFKEEFSRRKAERGVMDFDDMLSLAYQALRDERIAEIYRGRYDHVFMDEYQDTNPLQECIIAGVSREDNRFLVGDMKQSIYRFRMADPFIFAKKEQEYIKNGFVVYMNENFRSSDEVCKLTNFLMRRLMSPALGEIEYTSGQALVARAGLKGSAELLITLKDDAPDAESTVAQEARTIAARLREFLGQPIVKNGESVPAEWGDMAVLIRKTQGVTDVFNRIFRECGIPLCTAEKQSSIPVEAEMFVDILRVISGTFSDIALISLLRGPVGGMDEKELSRIRAEHPEGRFWDAFLAAAEDASSPAAAVYEKIKKWRALARGLTPGDLIICVKNEIDFEAWLAASEGGALAAANFRAFFEKLLGFSLEYPSIFELTAALDSVKKEKGVYAELTSSHESGAVRLISIHKSKGLEFPITVLALTAQGFSTKDTSKHMLKHSGIGLAADVIDNQSLTVRRPLSRHIMEHIIKRESRSEELRILYVALTRAKQHLIISGTVDKEEELWARAETGPYCLMDKGCLLSWILAALAPLACMQDINPFAGDDVSIDLPHRVTNALAHGGKRSESMRSGSELIELAKAQSAPDFFEYAYSGLPGKISVTSLLPEYEPPASIGNDGRGGMRAGTLVHLFLEKVQVGESQKDVDKEIEKLVKKELITAEDASVLSTFKDELSAFVNGELAMRIARAERVLREVPFTAYLSAIDPLHKDLSEPVVIQGIIDIAFKEADGWVILDYKSNYAGDEASAKYLTDHYRRQLELYESAWRAITDERVKEKYLYFVRGDRLVKLD